MLHDFSFQILHGGRYQCTPSTWDNPVRDSMDECFKAYRILSGEGFLADDTGEYRLHPGEIYLINGYRIRSRRCPRHMDLQWIHFLPDSLSLTLGLKKLPAVYGAAKRPVTGSEPTFSSVERIFLHPDEPERSRLVENLSVQASCAMQAMLLSMLSMAMEETPDLDTGGDPVDPRLRPAMEYMDHAYKSRPSLALIASHANLAPNYFHRLFATTFGQSPFEYMETKRMDLARRLLSDPHASIKAVAGRCGYEDPLYFSRAFTRRFGAAPSSMRKTLKIAP